MFVIVKSGYVFDMSYASSHSKLCLNQIHEIHHKVRPSSVELLRRDYAANGGWETFLSYEDPEKDILVGLLRLRKCSEDGTFRPELVRRKVKYLWKDEETGEEEEVEEEMGCSIVRELHVYGTAVPVHGRDPTKFQHQVCMNHPFLPIPLTKLQGIRYFVDGGV